MKKAKKTERYQMTIFDICGDPYANRLRVIDAIQIKPRNNGSKIKQPTQRQNQ